MAEPWRVAIEMASQSYREGGIAVGAVLTDGAGTLVGGVHIGAVDPTWEGIERLPEPANAALARAVHRRYQERPALPEAAVQALEYVWDLLAEGRAPAHRRG